MGSLQANPSAITSPLAASKRLDRKPDIHHIVLGDILFNTWYPSFYPDELVGKELDRLYVCQSCFKYTKEQQQYLAHLVSKRPVYSPRLLLYTMLTLIASEIVPGEA